MASELAFYMQSILCGILANINYQAPKERGGR
jgi:hypothetical protein